MIISFVGKDVRAREAFSILIVKKNESFSCVDVRDYFSTKEIIFKYICVSLQSIHVLGLRPLITSV